MNTTRWKTKNRGKLSSRAVQAGFRQDDLAYIKLPIAPKGVYQAFDLIGRAIWERKKHNLLQAEVLSTLRDTLLPRLISGQLRLPVAEAALEEAMA